MANNLQDFFKQNVEIITEVEYIASKRFKSASGDPLVWRIRVLENRELDKIRDRHKKRTYAPGTRQATETFDAIAFQEELCVSTIVYPELDDPALQNSWGVNGELELLKQMLNPGELTDLYSAVSEAQGYDQGFSNKVKAVKNS